MENYYSIEEISKKIGISRQQITKRVKKLGFDTKKLGDDEFKSILYDSLDVLKGKKSQSATLKASSRPKKVKSVQIAKKSGSTIEERLEKSKIEYDFIDTLLEEQKITIKESGTIARTSNGNASQSSAMKVYNDLIKSRNILQKEINELEEKLKLSKAPENKISVIGDE